MPVVLGTAGHIDHGKTSLVRAITGIDCDRLEEEKRRGITIELGFAYCDLPGGEKLGIVDVPGHERFVKNMVAGAAGIDFVMLIIAADEGVMPQTREHLEICSLLGIKRGLVALTKIDMVDADWLELVKDDVAAFLEGTFLENSPVFPVSSATGEGVPELRAHVLAMAQEISPARRIDLLRLPVDRVFTMKGHGTVTTGTIISGSVALGDEVELMPSGRAGKVRGLQTHGASSERGRSGQRCAVNIQGLEVGDIERGDTITHPGKLIPSNRWLALLTCLPSSPRPLRQRTEIHFHHGAREIPARVRFLDRDRLAPGETALTLVTFSAPMVGVFGDRCVLRSFSPLRTVAGGILVHPGGLILRKKDPLFESKVKMLVESPDMDVESLIKMQIRLAGSSGVGAAALSVFTGLESRQVEKCLQNLGSKGAVFCFDKEARVYIDVEALEALESGCLEHAADFHRKEPLKPVMSRGVLTSGWGRRLAPKLAHFVIELCLRKGKLQTEGDGLRLAGHKVNLGLDQAGLKNKILEAHTSAGITPPNMKEVLDGLGVEQKQAAPLIKVLMDEKALVKIKDNLYYAALALAGIESKIREWFKDHDDLDPGALKDLLDGISRKYVIALLEYFDRERITIRVGDKRQIRGRTA